MSALRRGVFAAIGVVAGFFGLAFVTLIFRYAPLWGTRESLYAVVYTSLAYVSFGGAFVAFLPRERMAELVVAGGGFLAALYAFGIPYYVIFGRGVNSIYLALVLVIGVILQVAFTGGFRFLSGRWEEGAESEPSA